VALANAGAARASQFVEELLQRAAAAASKEGTRVVMENFRQGGDGADHNPFAGAYEHLIRLTLFRVWSELGDPRAGPLLAQAHGRLMAEADRIRDFDLRQRFLTHITEHREIQAAAANARQA
jgi:hypothetical protein